MERVEAQGIHFVTLADFNDSQEARRKLYEVNYITSLETPGYDGDWMPFDEFEQHICGARVVPPTQGRWAPCWASSGWVWLRCA